MKKTRFALFAAAALVLVACAQEVQEKNTDVTPVVSENALAFNIQSGIATRSGEDAAIVSLPTGISIPVQVPTGEQISFEESVASLDGIYPEFNVSDAPETRGTPVYSENFKEAVGSFRGQAFPYQAFSYRVDRPTQGTLPTITEGNFDPLYGQWVRKFDADPWGEAENLYFFARVVTDDPSVAIQNQIGVLTNSYQYSYDAEQGQQMTFSYRSALTAVDQQDILFAARAIKKADANKGIPILFYHALTGVKFATAHENDGNTKTFIDKVELTGIYGYGKCYVTSVTEDDDYKDDPDIYSSMSAIRWEPSFGNGRTKTSVYSQEFSETPVDYAQGGSFGSKGKYADSFAAGGNTNNLNAADGSMTFWLVPQQMTNDVKLTVTFRIQSGDVISDPITTEIDFGKELNTKNGKTIEWKAGEIRTYTLKAGDVNIVITDKVVEHIKSDVTISNVGSVPQYVRAAIVAQWYGTDNNGVDGIAFGYQNEVKPTSGEDALTEPWALGPMAGGSISSDNYGGVFTGLPGDNWVRARDGFFYYKNPIPIESSAADALFTDYTLNEAGVPTIYYPDKNSNKRVAYEDVRLVMEIPVQAIEATAADMADAENGWLSAWTRALGEEKKPVVE